MIPDLVKTYETGAITAHHLAVQCVHMVEPSKPEPVLAPLPDDVLIAIEKFADDYEPKGMKTNFGVIPAQDQVIAATKWIRGNRVHLAKSE